MLNFLRMLDVLGVVGRDDNNELEEEEEEEEEVEILLVRGGRSCVSPVTLYGDSFPFTDPTLPKVPFLSDSTAVGFATSESKSVLLTFASSIVRVSSSSSLSSESMVKAV